MILMIQTELFIKQDHFFFFFFLCVFSSDVPHDKISS